MKTLWLVVVAAILLATGVGIGLAAGVGFKHWREVILTALFVWFLIGITTHKF